MHSNYRGLLEWKSLGLPMSTASDEACKMYDAAVTQQHGWYNDETLGGMEGTMQRMFKADPDFVMGHVLKNIGDVTSGNRTLHGDPTLANDLSRMSQLADTLPGVTTREKKHVKAAHHLAEGYSMKAAEIYEDILLEHPYDTLAIALAHNVYFKSGRSFQIRDSIARVLPHWNPSTPLYGYMLGFHAFGLEESNMFSQAEVLARKALDINPKDAWSTHVLCHVFEMTGRQQEGIRMMEDTQSDWTHGTGLSCHNFWHMAVDNIELGNYEVATTILDEQLTPRLNNNGNIFNLTDITAILYRLQFEGVSVGDRWSRVSDIYKSHLEDHIWAFNDVNLYLACLNADDGGASANKMMSSIEEFLREGKGDTRDVMAEVGTKIMQAFAAYKEGDYSSTVDLMFPIRYRVAEIGGSIAQRDLFNLFLIQAAIRSPLPHHHRLARNLLNERKAIVANAPMTDRMMAKLMETHAH